MEPQVEQRKPISPYEPRSRKISEIILDLREPLHDSLVKQRKVKNQTIDYIEWHTAVRALDYFAPGWTFEVRMIVPVGGEVGVVGRLTIPASDGDFFRESTGSESTKEEDVKKMFGSPMTNSEAQAFKRCAAKFGFGLYLYLKED